MADNFEYRPWDDPRRVEPAYDGIERRVLACSEELLLVHYTVAEGAVFPEHEHEETHQGVYVLDGALELFGDHEETLEAGDTFVVGPGERHGIRGLAEETHIVDAFSPPIERYVAET
jgi:quercetin dioxygenase-like cupin family protein